MDFFGEKYIWQPICFNQIWPTFKNVGQISILKDKCFYQIEQKFDLYTDLHYYQLVSLNSLSLVI